MKIEPALAKVDTDGRQKIQLVEKVPKILVHMPANLSFLVPDIPSMVPNRNIALHSKRPERYSETHVKIVVHAPLVIRCWRCGCRRCDGRGRRARCRWRNVCGLEMRNAQKRERNEASHKRL